MALPPTQGLGNISAKQIEEMYRSYPGHSADASRYAMAGATTWFDPSPPTFKINIPPDLNKMIASRMRWGEGALPPFKAIQAYPLSEEQVVVFVIAGERALIIHDDANLFPSDALVTQLCLLEKN
jgi:hypothetical protein